MVNIKLDNTWTLVSDSHQWMLAKEGRADKFLTSLEGAILCYFELKLRGSNAQTIKGLLEYHKGLCEALCKALTPLKFRVVPMGEKE